MTHIWPCNRCPLREGCEQRDVHRKKAAGLGLLGIRVRCDRLSAELRPGRRILVSKPVAVPVYSLEPEDFRIEKVAVKATITHGADARQTFGCVVDPPGEPEGDERRFRFRRRKPHTRVVAFLDEPDATVCDMGRVQRATGCDAPQEGDCLCKPDLK